MVGTLRLLFKFILFFAIFGLVLSDFESFSSLKTEFLTSHQSFHYLNNGFKCGAKDDINPIIFPTCSTFDPVLKNVCPSPRCEFDKCFATPVDTISFSSLPLNSSHRDNIVCPIPSNHDGYIHPISSLPYDVKLVNVTGRLTGRKVGSEECEILPFHQIQVHQVNQFGLSFDHPSSSWMHSEVSDALLRRGLSMGGSVLEEQRGNLIEEIINSSYSSSNLQTCSETIVTDSQGGFSFLTVSPASVGPPQHIGFRVDEDGYELLETNMVR